MTDAELLEAMEIDDAYSVVRVLAQHKVGVTELVRSPEGRLCVRKRIPPELANREAWESLRALRSSLLPRVEQLYELPDVLVVVCPYVAGTSVSELLESGVCMTPLEAVAVAEGVCDALGLLHAAAIIHRDVSPGNVIIAPDVAGGSLRSRVCLIDLGVARVSKGQATHDTKPLGTMGFSAPEQYGFAQTDERSDLYSAGRLLLCLLCGRIVDDMAPNMDDLMVRQGIPGPLREVVRRACAFEPSARYQSARQMVMALESAERTIRSSSPAVNTGAPVWDRGAKSVGRAAPAPVASTKTNPSRRSGRGHKARRRVLNVFMFASLLVSAWLGISIIYALVALPLAKYYGAVIVMSVVTMGLVGIAWTINRFLEKEGESEEPQSIVPLVLKIAGVIALAFVIVCIIAVIVVANQCK